MNPPPSSSPSSVASSLTYNPSPFSFFPNRALPPQSEFGSENTCANFSPQWIGWCWTF
ncbi:hypothetical protein HanIR_Chr12g0571411 [Helianthus annuus]|nr:hypothetical protein HanIR_Chr12g0571411 [Helianthus annuus]